jgi:type II secretory pathway pseudopilin PulG
MIDRTVLWQMILILLGCVLIVAGKSCRKSKRDRKILITLGIVCIILGVAVISLQVTTEQAHAATTVPAKRMYKGHLLDAAGKPLTAPHVIRFSYWKSADAVPSDFNAGAINTNAPNFVSWQESHVVTPGANGYFAVQLGSTNPLPDYTTMPTETLLSLYLQVEVKKSGDPDSMFEDLDVDPTDAGRDRSPILSVPFARNADLLDQRDVGTGSGDIVYLMSGGLLDIGAIPGGTERDAFAVDADGSSQTPTLSFGQNLAKTLKYDMVDSRFVFNDDLRILGDLTVTGLINGVNIEGLVGGGADSVSSGSLVFQPGYPSAAYEADGSGNVGRLFVDHDAGSKQNHYSWTSTMASLQDYDVRLRVTLPRTFAGWDTLLPMRVDYRSSSLLPINSKLDIAVYDTAGNAVTLVGTSQSLAATSWSTASLSFAPGSTWTAGSDFLVIFKLSAKSNERVDLGALKLYLKE